MKPRTFFLAITGPFMLWVGLATLLSRWAETLPDGHALGVVERMLIAGGLAGARAMPFAVLAAVIAAPLLTLLAASLVRPRLRGRAGMAATLPWVAVFAGSLIFLAGVLVSERAIQLALPLFWCVAAAHAILVGIAFRAQLALRSRGVTKVPAAVVLGLGVVLQLAFQWPGVVVAVVPLVSGWRELEAA